MPNKMTDNDVVRALECCKDTSAVNCGECPYCENCVSDENVSHIMTDALDLINRQKAEIERLLTENHSLAIVQEGFKDMYKIAEAEAVKEFAERLKAKAEDKLPMENSVDEVDIDNLLKEMVGENDAEN